MSDTDITTGNAENEAAQHTEAAEPQTQAEVSEAVREATPSKAELDAMSASELRTYLDALPDKVAEAVKSVIPKAPRPARPVEKVEKVEKVEHVETTTAAPEAPKRKGGKLAGWYSR